MASCPPLAPSNTWSSPWYSSRSTSVCCGYASVGVTADPDFELVNSAECLKRIAPGLVKEPCMGVVVPDGGSDATEAPAAPWKVRGPALRVDVPFEVGKAALDERGRQSLDEVHVAYVKERCWFVLIGGVVSPVERRRGLGKDLALSRSGAVGRF